MEKQTTRSIIAIIVGIFLVLPIICEEIKCNINNNDVEVVDTVEILEWDVDFDRSLYSDVCNIERRDGITEEEFRERYQDKLPIILTNINENKKFQELTSKKELLEHYGDLVITLSSANTFSYDKEYVTLREYVIDMMGPQSIEIDGIETFYAFGNNHNLIENTLLPEYQRPPFAQSYEKGSLSFGFAGSGTGVPLHRHGPVFAEVLHGMKRWFVYPPEYQPLFDPEASTLQWLSEVYPTMEQKPMECVLKPGEVLYLPSFWWHSTLNIGQSVFISTFV